MPTCMTRGVNELHVSLLNKGIGVDITYYLVRVQVQASYS